MIGQSPFLFGCVAGFAAGVILSFLAFWAISELAKRSYMPGPFARPDIDLHESEKAEEAKRGLSA